MNLQQIMATHSRILQKIIELLHIDMKYEIQFSQFDYQSECALFYHFNKGEYQVYKDAPTGDIAAVMADHKAFMDDILMETAPGENIYYMYDTALYCDGLYAVIVIRDYAELCELYDMSLLQAALNLDYETDEQEMINKKGRELIDSTDMPRVFYEILNTITALRYESAEVNSRIYLVDTDTLPIIDMIQFKEPIANDTYKTVRKLAEISTGNLALIGSKYLFYGFAEWRDVERNVSLSKSPTYRIDLKGTMTWDISVCNAFSKGFVSYLSSHMGDISYPTKKIEKSTFIDTLNSELREFNGEALWNIVTNAIKQKHGTMLVIAKDAAEEAKRLSHCAIGIDRFDLNDAEFQDTVKHLSSIDGAILCDPNGICHAIGVILDGVHIENNDENMERGARHNSAKRYFAWRKKELDKSDCVIVIVSEDGDVTLVPDITSPWERET